MSKQLQRKRYYYYPTSSSEESSEEKPSCLAKWRKRNNPVVRSFLDLSAEEKSHDSSSSTRNSNRQERERLHYVLLSENATAPERATGGSAGYDLCSAYNYELPSMAQVKIETDLAIGVPNGCYLRLAMRSGIASRYSLLLLGGVIDRDYTGSISILLFNCGREPFIVKKGQRIAQFICEQILTPEPLEVKELEKTKRANKGFGSTGI